jgi:hypothetical protein
MTLRCVTHSFFYSVQSGPAGPVRKIPWESAMAPDLDEVPQANLHVSEKEIHTLWLSEYVAILRLHLHCLHVPAFVFFLKAPFAFSIRVLESVILVQKKKEFVILLVSDLLWQLLHLM